MFDERKIHRCEWFCLFEENHVNQAVQKKIEKKRLSSRHRYEDLVS